MPMPAGKAKREQAAFFGASDPGQPAKQCETEETKTNKAKERRPVFVNSLEKYFGERKKTLEKY